MDLNHLISSTDKAIAALDKKGKVSRGELLSEITTLKEEVFGEFECCRLGYAEMFKVMIDKTILIKSCYFKTF